MSKQLPKLYWIANESGGQMGRYDTREEAQKFIDSGFLPKDEKYTIVEKEADICPTCNRPAEKEIIQGLGECLNCDHVRGDVMIEERFDREEYDNYDEDY